MLLSFFLLFIVENKAQNLNNTSNFKETIHVSTNACVYLAGEVVLYKLFCNNENNNSPSMVSKIAYVDVVSSAKKVVIRNKIFLENSQGNGDFFIPTDFESGEYQIISYTHYILNDSQNRVNTKSITIINPYKINSALIKNKEFKTQDSFPRENNSKKQIASLQQYNNRSLVTIPTNNIHTNLRNAVVSVRKKDKLDSIYNEELYNNKIHIGTNKIVFPEHRGEIISGKISTNSPNLSLKDITVALSFPGKKFEGKITKTDKSGFFLFNLEQKISNNNGVLQIFDSNKEAYSISLDDTPVIDYSNLSFQKNNHSNSNLKNVIEERSVANQIENAYIEFKRDSISLETFQSPFYDSTNSMEYILDDYTRFSTLKETIIEVIDGLYLKKNKEAYTLHVSDKDVYTELELPPLILVDGLFIQDINELLNHKAELFQSIHLIYGGYYFGNNLYNGVVAFSTKNNTYESNLNGTYILKPNWLRPLPYKKYFQPNYSNFQDKTPDYRYQLYWNTNYTNLEKAITFYTSDIDGIFEIKIEGYNDKNEYVQQVQYFEVK